MALENIVSPAWRRRWMIAFAFGLVHGFGFSFALRDTLQFAGTHLLTSLLSFNVGVELGQVVVLLLLIPALELLFRFGVAERMGTIVLSAIVAHTGWHWMIRTRQPAHTLPVRVAGVRRGVFRVGPAVDDDRGGGGGPGVVGPRRLRPAARVRQDRRDAACFGRARLEGTDWAFAVLPKENVARFSQEGPSLDCVIMSLRVIYSHLIKKGFHVSLLSMRRRDDGGGRLILAVRTSFRPQDSKFLTLQTGDVMTKATMCRSCGLIEIIGDVNKLRRLTGDAEAEPVQPGVPVRRNENLHRARFLETLPPFASRSTGRSIRIPVTSPVRTPGTVAYD